MYDLMINLIHDRRRKASVARYSNFCIRRGVIAVRVVEFRGGEEGRRRIVKNCFPLVFLQLSPTPPLPTNFRRNHLARSFSFPPHTWRETCRVILFDETWQMLAHFPPPVQLLSLVRPFDVVFPPFLARDHRGLSTLCRNRRVTCYLRV